jgi:hypothetical protein
MKEGVVGTARKLARQVGAAFVALGTITAVIGLVGALGMGIASSASVEPVLVLGNPSCADLGYAGSLKVDPPSAGQHSGGGLTVTVTIDGASFDWSSSTIAVSAVVAKGGPDANVYTYVPPALSDTDLVTPTNPNNGQPYGLSHIEFCFVPGGPTTTTVAPTTTTVAPTTTTVAPTTTSSTLAPTTTVPVTVTTLGSTTTTEPVTSSTTETTASPTVTTLQTPTTTAAGGELPITGGAAQALLLAGFALVGLGARLMASGRAPRHQMY